MKSADVLIAGGGVIGASIAYHLAVQGFKNILVMDKFPQPGSGSTGKATGGFRAQFGSEINIKLSLLSRSKLLSFKDELGVDPEFRQTGYMFLAQNENELTLLRNANSLQKSCGLTQAEIISIEDIKKINPYINNSGITGGAFCPTDGFISPLEILKGYTEGARRLGVTFAYGSEIKGFIVQGSNIESVITSSGKTDAKIIINAAGAWAGEIAKLAGADLPIKPLKRQVAAARGKDILPADLPMTVWTDNSFHFRMKDGKLILLLPSEPQNPDPFNTDVEDAWLDKVFSIAKERIPKINDTSIDKAGSWAGLYEMSPDEHVMLGLVPGLENFYLAGGSSGHGVMHSPAIGELLAGIISGEKDVAVDTSILSPDRFTENKPIKSIKFF